MISWAEGSRVHQQLSPSSQQIPVSTWCWLLGGYLIPPLLVPLMSVFCFACSSSVLVSRFALLAKFCLIFNSEPDSYLLRILLLPCILVAASLVPDPSPAPPLQCIFGITMFICAPHFIFIVLWLGCYLFNHLYLHCSGVSLM